MTRPPRLAERLLHARLHPAERDELLGDLAEQFQARVRLDGAPAARRWYWHQALSLGWGFFVRRRDEVSSSHERLRGGWAASTATADLRYAVRSLRHSPVSAVIAVVLMSSAIGLSTAVFSLTSSILLKPLPVTDQDHIVRLSEVLPQDTGVGRGNSITLGEVERGPTLADVTIGTWTKASRTLDAIAPYTSSSATVTAGGAPVQVIRGTVGGRFFDVLPAPVVHGRLLTATDAETNAADVAVLSEEFWQRQFSGRDDVVGRQLQIEGLPHTIVGVVSNAFDLPEAGVDLWVPGRWRWPSPGGAPVGARVSLSLGVVARMRAGATVEDVEVEGQQIAATIAMAGSGFVDGQTAVPRVVARRLLDDLVAPVRPALLLLAVGMACVLVAACVNLANLILARNTARQTEIAVRLALGANRWRIVRPLIMEQTILATTGAAAGALLAWWILRALPTIAPADLPRLADVVFSTPALAVSSLIALVTSAGVGLLPAWQVPSSGLREFTAGGRHAFLTRGGSAQSARGVLVVAQVALATVLLVGAALIGRSLLALLSVDPGYHPDQALTFQVALPDDVSSQRGRLKQFFDAVMEELRAEPSIIAVGHSSMLPLHRGLSLSTFRIKGRDYTGTTEWPRATSEIVTPDYFRAIGSQVIAGREFAPSDTTESELVTIVNDTLAHWMFPDSDPIGQRILSYGRREWTIVGVVKSIHRGPLTEAAGPAYYLPAGQIGDFLAFGSVGGGLAIRTAGDPRAVLPAVRATVARVNAAAPIYNVMTLDERLDATFSQPRFYALTLALFAALALLTALLGIYGVLSYAVERRYRELAVRRALGATERALTWSVVGGGVRMAVVGLVLGLAAAGIGAQFIRSLLFGVGATDPAAFTGVAVAIVTVVLIASWQPVRRAMRIDPARALRID